MAKLNEEDIQKVIVYLELLLQGMSHTKIEKIYKRLHGDQGWSRIYAAVRALRTKLTDGRRRK